MLEAIIGLTGFVFSWLLDNVPFVAAKFANLTKTQKQHYILAAALVVSLAYSLLVCYTPLISGGVCADASTLLSDWGTYFFFLVTGNQAGYLLLAKKE